MNNVADPSIYVTYHDAQAYPEYLVKFKQEGVEHTRGAYSQSAAPQPQSAAPAPQVPRPSRLGRQMNVVVPSGLKPGDKLARGGKGGVVQGSHLGLEIDDSAFRSVQDTFRRSKVCSSHYGVF